MAKITRRDLMRSGVGLAGLAAGGSLLGCGSSGGGGNQGPVCPPAVFPQSEELVSAHGFLEFPLCYTMATNPVGTPAGPRTFRSRTFNGLLAGQTLRVRAGDRLEVPIFNKLPLNPVVHPAEINVPHNFNSVNLHTHGFHVSPFQDEVLIEIEPGGQYTYEYDIPADHPAGTMWYHPHKHGATAMHLLSGMSGVIVVEGDASNGDLRTVPEIAAADEIIFNINELNLKDFGIDPDQTTPYEVPDYDKPGPFSANDRLFIVNGVYQPRLEVRPGQVVRLRMLNASARTLLPISVQGTSAPQMHLCALDGITIPSVRAIDEITLSPGNRADILLRFDEPGTYEIFADAFQPSTLGPPGAIAYVDVAGDSCDMALPTGALPTPTSLPDILPGEITETRDLVYAIDDCAATTPNPMMLMPPPGPDIHGSVAPNFTMDGKRFDPNVVNQELTIGSVLEWTLKNHSNRRHPHHIHIHPFQVIQTSDNTLLGMPFPPPGDPDWQPLWLDTVAIAPTTEMASMGDCKFTNPSLDGFAIVRQRYPDNPGFYVIHCHILTHEDIGMMQLVHLST